MAKRFVSAVAKKLKRSDGICCPYCGGIDGLSTNDRVMGWIEREVSWGGDTLDTSLDKLRENIPQSGRCVTCHRVVANPQSLSTPPTEQDDGN